MYGRISEGTTVKITGDVSAEVSNCITIEILEVVPEWVCERKSVRILQEILGRIPSETTAFIFARIILGYFLGFPGENSDGISGGIYWTLLFIYDTDLKDTF